MPSSFTLYIFLGTGTPLSEFGFQNNESDHSDCFIVAEPSHGGVSAVGAPVSFSDEVVLAPFASEFSSLLSEDIEIMNIEVEHQFYQSSMSHLLVVWKVTLQVGSEDNLKHFFKEWNIKAFKYFVEDSWFFESTVGLMLDDENWRSKCKYFGNYQVLASAARVLSGVELFLDEEVPEEIGYPLNSSGDWVHFGWKGGAVFGDYIRQINGYLSMVLFAQASYFETVILRRVSSSFVNETSLLGPSVLASLAELEDNVDECRSINLCLNNLKMRYLDYSASLVPLLYTRFNKLWSLWHLESTISEAHTVVEAHREFILNKIEIGKARVERKQQFALNAITILQAVTLVTFLTETYLFYRDGHRFERYILISCLVTVSLLVAILIRRFSLKSTLMR